jgi:hypothetical protein
MNCRQEVVDAYLNADALTLKAVSSFWLPVDSLETRNSKLGTEVLMFFPHRTRQVDHGQQDENVSLQERHADMQSEKYDRHAY